MISFTLAASLFLFFITGNAAGIPTNVPPKISGKVQFLGHTKDAPFGTGNASNPNDPGYYSDGGAGGFVNGYKLLTLSDARTINVTNPQYTPLVHTVYAYAGTRNNDPTEITIIGDYKANPHFYLTGNGGSGVISSQPSDACQGGNFGPGPNTMMVGLGSNNGNPGATVWTIFCGHAVYNTLIEFDVVDPNTLVASNQNINANRTVLQLFQATQPLYGSDGLAADDTFMYLVAATGAVGGQGSKGGYKLARVKKASRTDRSAYKYYCANNGTWSTTIPDTSDQSVNFFNGTNPGAGTQFGSDLFFSEYFNTWLFSYSAKDVYSASYYMLAYSTTGNAQGPYADLGTFYQPQTDVACDPSNPGYVPQSKGSVPGVYLTHSHPGFDTTGKTLLIGWISCNTVTDLARITFQ